MFRRGQWSDVLTVIFTYRNLQSFTYKIPECQWNTIAPFSYRWHHSNWIWAWFGRNSLAAWRLDLYLSGLGDLCCFECRRLWYNLQSRNFKGLADSFTEKGNPTRTKLFVLIERVIQSHGKFRVLFLNIARKKQVRDSWYWILQEKKNL